MPANFISALLAAGGNSRASRSARAKLQWRDRFGRFVEMGRGIKFKVRLSSGASVSVIGKFTGVAGGNPDYGSVYVKGDKNGLKDGFYEVKSSNGQEILASLTPEYLEGRGIEVGKDANGNPVGERVESDIPNQTTIPFSETPEGWTPRKDGQPGYQTEDGDYSVTPNGTGWDLYQDGALESNQQDWATAIARVDAIDNGTADAADPATPATPENAATPAPEAATTPGLDLTTGGVAPEGSLVPVPGISEAHSAADVTPETLAQFVDTNRAELSKGGKRLTVKWDANGDATYGISDAVADRQAAMKLATERGVPNDILDLTGGNSAQEPDNSDPGTGEPLGDDAGADPGVVDSAAPEDDAEPARVPGAPASAPSVDLESREYLQSRLTKLIETQKGVENPRAWERLDKQIDETTAKLDALDAAESDAPETPEAAAPATAPEPSPEPDAEAPTPASDPAPEADAAPSPEANPTEVAPSDSVETAPPVPEGENENGPDGSNPGGSGDSGEDLPGVEGQPDGRGDSAPQGDRVSLAGTPVERAPRVQELANRGVPVADLLELDPQKDAGAFRDAISKLKENNKWSASVHVYDEDEYRDMRLFATEDGTAGIALRGEDIISGFVHDNSPHRGVARSMLAQMIALGGRRGDAFDTVLPKIYALEGFHPVARLKFDDDQKPEGWDYETYASFNAGRPDIVFMVSDPNRVDEEYTPGEGVLFDDYDKAVEAQAQAVSDANAPESDEVPDGTDVTPIVPEGAPEPEAAPALPEAEEVDALATPNTVAQTAEIFELRLQKDRKAALAELDERIRNADKNGESAYNLDKVRESIQDGIDRGAGHKITVGRDADGKITGTLTMRAEKDGRGGKIALIDSLYSVAPGNGAGKALLQKAATEAISSNARLTVVGALQDAKEFYARMGASSLSERDFQETGDNYDGFGQWSNIAQKELAAGTPADNRSEYSGWMKQPSPEAAQAQRDRLAAKAAAQPKWVDVPVGGILPGERMNNNSVLASIEWDPEIKRFRAVIRNRTNGKEQTKTWTRDTSFYVLRDPNFAYPDVTLPNGETVTVGTKLTNAFDEEFTVAKIARDKEGGVALVSDNGRTITANRNGFQNYKVVSPEDVNPEPETEAASGFQVGDTVNWRGANDRLESGVVTGVREDGSLEIDAEVGDRRANSKVLLQPGKAFAPGEETDHPTPPETAADAGWVSSPNGRPTQAEFDNAPEGAVVRNDYRESESYFRAGKRWYRVEGDNEESNFIRVRDMMVVGPEAETEADAPEASLPTPEAIDAMLDEAFQEAAETPAPAAPAQRRVLTEAERQEIEANGRIVANEKGGRIPKFDFSPPSAEEDPATDLRNRLDEARAQVEADQQAILDNEPEDVAVEATPEVQLEDSAEAIEPTPEEEDPTGMRDTMEDYADAKFPPTQEQLDIINAVLEGKNVAVQALAGTGKTSTLEIIANRIKAKFGQKSRILYIAFNTSVRNEAALRMPDNVESRTGDSLAWRATAKNLKDKLGNPKALFRNRDIALQFNIRDVGEMPEEDVARELRKAISKYVISDADTITADHFAETELPFDAQTEAWANAMWADLNDPKGVLPFSFEHATKRWALSRPDLSKAGSGVERPADVIFFDEAQDINPVMAKVVRDQTSQKVYVGDGRQAIYGFRGAENELDKVETDVVLPLTKSWRFGPEVAGMGNRFLSLLKSPFKIIGGGQKGEVLRAGSMTDADAVLTRTNSGAIKAILEELERGRTVGVRKKYKKELTQLVDTAAFLKGFGKKPSSPHADLNGYSTWDEIEQDVEKGKATRKVETLFKLVDRYGTDQLRDALERVVAMPEAGESNGAPAGAPAGGYAPITVEDGATGELFPGVNYNVVKTPAGGFIMSLSGKATFMNRDMLKAAGFWKWNMDAKSWSAPETKDPERLKALAEGARPEGAAGSPAAAEATPDVIISTAHQAKGAEWDNVRIADDFWGPRVEVDPATGETFTEYPAPEELRLAYVAVTRAKKVLDPGALAWVLDHTDDEDEDPEVESKGLPRDDFEPAPEPTPEVSPEPAPEVVAEPAPTPEVVPEPTPEPEPAAAPEAAPEEAEDDGLPNTIEELEDLAEALDIRAAKGGAAGRIAQRNLDKIIEKIEKIEEANNAPAAEVIPEPVAAPEVNVPDVAPVRPVEDFSDEEIQGEIWDIGIEMNLDRMAGEQDDDPVLVERQNLLIDEQNRRATEKARALPASDKQVAAIEQARQGKDLDDSAAAALAEAQDDEDLTAKRAQEILDEIQVQANSANTASKPREFVPETYTNGNRALLNPEPFDDIEPNLILRDLKENHPGFSTLTNGDIVIFSREFQGRTYEVVVRRNAREHFQTYIRETDKATGIARIRKDPREVHSYAALSKRLTARKLELSGANPLKWMNTRRDKLVLPPEANGMLDADALDGLIRGTDLPESKSELLNEAMGILADMIIDGQAPRDILDIVAADRGFTPALVDTVIASTVRRKIADEAREKFRNRPSHMSYDGVTILKEGDTVDWTDWRETSPTYGQVFRGSIRTVQYNADPGKPYKYSDGVRAVFPEYNRIKGVRDSQDRQFTTANLKPVTDPASRISRPFFAKKEELAARKKQFTAADFGLPANGKPGKSIPRPAAAKVPKPEEVDVNIDINGQAYIGPDDAPVAVPFNKIDAAQQFAGLKRVDVRAAKIQVGDMIIGLDYAGDPAPAQVVEVLPWSDGSVRIVTLVSGDFGGAVKKTLEIPAGGPAPTVYRADIPGAPVQPESSAPTAWEDKPANPMQYGIIRDLQAQKKLSAASAKVVERALANQDLTQGQAAALVGELVNHKDAKKVELNTAEEIAQLVSVFDKAGARAVAEQMIAQDGRDLTEFGEYIVNEIDFKEVTTNEDFDPRVAREAKFVLEFDIYGRDLLPGDLIAQGAGHNPSYVQVLKNESGELTVRVVSEDERNGNIESLYVREYGTQSNVIRPRAASDGGPENYFRPDVRMAGVMESIPGIPTREVSPGSVGEYDALAVEMRERWYAGEGAVRLDGWDDAITEGIINRDAGYFKAEDGTELFQKVVTTEDEVHKEVLASRIAYQLGISDVIVAGDLKYKRVLMTRITGDMAMSSQEADEIDRNPKKYPNARLIGMLDYLIGNGDRHEGNWFVDENGQPVPIDHGNIIFGAEYSTSPFVRALGRLVTRNAPTQPLFTEAELIGYRQRLLALRDDFTASNHPEWHDSVMAKIDKLIANY